MKIIGYWNDLSTHHALNAYLFFFLYQLFQLVLGSLPQATKQGDNICLAWQTETLRPLYGKKKLPKN